MRQKIAIVPVHPLPTGDAGGNVSFLVVMALIIGGYLASTIGMAFGGPPTRRRRRLGSLAIVSVIGRAAHGRDRRAGTRRASQLEVPRPVGRLRARDDGRLVRHGRPPGLFGAAGTLVVVVLFVIFGAPASGGTVPSPFLPDFWRTFGPYLPAGAGTTLVRNTVYFGGNAIGRSLVVLAGYLWRAHLWWRRCEGAARRRPKLPPRPRPRRQRRQS